MNTGLLAAIAGAAGADAPPPAAPIISLDGASGSITTAAAVGTRLTTVRLSAPAAGTWSVSGWSKVGLSSDTGQAVDLVTTAALTSVDEGVKTLTIAHTSAAGTKVYTLSVNPAPVGDTGKELWPYGGEWFGNGCVTINSGNQKITTTPKGICSRVDRSGNLIGVMLQIASNYTWSEWSQNRKAKGEGNISLPWKIYKGKAPTAADDAPIASVPGTELGAGTKVHNRGTMPPANGSTSSAAARMFHFFRMPVKKAVVKGDYIHCIIWNGDPDPANNHISLNGAGCYTASGGTTPTIKNHVPYDLDPPRHTGCPWFGDHHNFRIDAKSSAATSWKLYNESAVGAGVNFANMTLVYEEDDGSLLKYNQRCYWDGYHTNTEGSGPNSYSGYVHVGGNNRMRMRWQHPAGYPMTATEIWLNAYYWKGYKPTAPLKCDFIDETSGTTKTVQWSPASADNDTDIATINPWAKDMSGLYYPYKRAVLSSSQNLVPGRIYSLEFYSDSPTNFYGLPYNKNLNYGMGYPDGPMGTQGIWRNAVGAAEGVDAFVERKTGVAPFVNWAKVPMFTDTDYQSQVALMCVLRTT